MYPLSRICGGLDGVMDSFLDRPLDAGPHCYLWLDALSQKVREEGRIVNASVAVLSTSTIFARCATIIFAGALSQGTCYRSGAIASR